MSEKKNPSLLVLSNAPHIRTNDSISKIMWFVVVALTPSSIYSIYLFGIKAALIIFTGIVSAVVAEALFQFIAKKPISVKDGSAVITGLLIAMNVPPESPLWMVAIGSFFAIIIVKQLFGGLGFNIFNPALAARAFMLASWPVHMTTGWHKFAGANVLCKCVINGVPQNAIDVLSSATPLSLLKEGPKLLAEHNISPHVFYDLLFSSKMIKALFVGNVGGVVGETSVALLVLGGLFLLYKKVITWHIPVIFIGTVGVLAFSYYAIIGFDAPYIVAVFHMFSGGLVLGAFFMATDMVTSPVTAKGQIIFAAGAGFLTFVIRIWGGYPEAVSYAILLMNALVPLIDRYLKPKVFGTQKVNPE